MHLYAEYKEANDNESLTSSEASSALSLDGAAARTQSSGTPNARLRVRRRKRKQPQMHKFRLNVDAKGEVESLKINGEEGSRAGYPGMRELEKRDDDIGSRP